MTRSRLVSCGVATLALSLAVSAQTPVKQDPLVRMPGTQPAPEGGVTLEAPNRCLNCHGDYDHAVEPGFNWKGSMMAQASRDFLFWSCMTVAAQDSAFAYQSVGAPASYNVTDLCIRCHFPVGWVEGRSDPTNAAAMSGGDFDGVSCDVCHSAMDPFFETTHQGSREGNDWRGYWDETDASSTPSAAAAAETYDEDRLLSAGFLQFNGQPFFAGNLPPVSWLENGSGQFFLSPNRDKRSSFADAEARHQMLYSRYHKSKYFCGTCHDVSNPVLQNLGADPTGRLPTEEFPAFSYFHVERTFSEFMLSAYGQPGGAPGIGPYDPGSFQTSLSNNNIARCQDCHLPDGVGAGCNKAGTPIRPVQSVEHPKSGVPVHDMTGGNAWVPWVLASTVSGSPNYDPVNDQLLNQGAGALTLDFSQGQPLDPQALLDGVGRAQIQLERAAAIEGLTYESSTGDLSFRIQNQSGHKLISGFPEGRRMFVNVKVFSGTGLVHEINPYDSAAGTLRGLTYNYQPDPGGVLPAPAPLAVDERYIDELVYECKPSSTLTNEDKSFHFVLADERYKDNRIPPKGFDIGNAAARLSVPRWGGAPAPDYFTAAEYAGGYDQIDLTVPANADHVQVTLLYQTTSREYVEFLRDEIKGTGNLTLPAGNYVVQTDPFFDGLRAWGDTLWDLWTHNMNVPGAAPIAMASAAFGTPAADTAGVSDLDAGVWITSGKGNNRTTQFLIVVPPDSFAQGDEIVLRARVIDTATLLPLAGAVVDFQITGPESPAVTSSPSDNDGIAEARWQTSAPKRGRPGTATGMFLATLTGITATGFVWDDVRTEVPFLLQ